MDTPTATNQTDVAFDLMLMILRCEDAPKFNVLIFKDYDGSELFAVAKLGEIN